MNLVRTIYILVLGTLGSFAQTTVVLQPGAAEGKDALLSSINSGINYGNHADFASVGWTHGQYGHFVRSIIDFDLSQIPSGTDINGATLSLYAYDSPANGTHSSLTGPNASLLQRIVEPWDEHEVTWGNQPITTSQNQVLLASSESETQSYTDIDVTALIRDYLSKPGESFGFLLKLENEQSYRKMVFASSDHPNSNLHPKLEITYGESQCLTLHPGAEGKDARVNSHFYTSTWPDHREFTAMAWTNGGNEVIVRSFISFDLSQIPSNAELEYAKLSLYSFYSPGNGHHSTFSGSNASFIQRVIEPWEEATINWNNQPLTTVENQVTLAQSGDSIQDYLDVDVTAIIRDILETPNEGYGMMIRLKEEQYYRKMIFASGDNSDESLRPKLQVCFRQNVGIEEQEYPVVKIFPNPTKGNQVNIFIPGLKGQATIRCYNQLGVLQMEEILHNEHQTISMENFCGGLYYFSIEYNQRHYTQRIQKL